jgi:hypothetical protein
MGCPAYDDTAWPGPGAEGLFPNKADALIPGVVLTDMYELTIEGGATPMPWTFERYPPAMQRLPPEVRGKAIEIANAMLAEGYEEGQAIRMAIAAARKWVWEARDRSPA